MDCDPIGLPAYCSTHRREWKDCKKMELNAERDSGLVLKPGMRVRVEIEAEVEAPAPESDLLSIAGMAFNRDGTRQLASPGDMKITVLPNTVEVTVRLTGPGLTESRAARLVRYYLEQPCSISLAREIQFDVNRPKGD